MVSKEKKPLHLLSIKPPFLLFYILQKNGKEN